MQLCRDRQRLALYMCPNDRAVPLPLGTAQQCKTKHSTLENVSSSRVGAAALKEVKIYFRVQESLYSHLTF